MLCASCNAIMHLLLLHVWIKLPIDPGQFRDRKIYTVFRTLHSSQDFFRTVLGLDSGSVFRLHLIVNQIKSILIYLIVGLCLSVLLSFRNSDPLHRVKVLKYGGFTEIKHIHQ
jgi:hypothetical protein